jgi:hypothetical protein
MRVIERIRIVTALAGMLPAADRASFDARLDEAAQVGFALMGASDPAVLADMGFDVTVVTSRLSALAADMTAVLLRSGRREADIIREVHTRLRAAGQAIPVADVRVRRPGVGL